MPTHLIKKRPSKVRQLPRTPADTGRIAPGHASAGLSAAELRRIVLEVVG